MKRMIGITASFVFALTLFGCANMSGGGGWTTLIDGSSGLENFDQVGEANWRAQDGTVMADKGKGGHLVTKKSYKDFQVHAEFWADHTTNSGIFIRITNPQKITATDAYEVNIFDQRPGPEYGTGAIVNFAKVDPMPKAGGKWNTFDITARGPEVIVVMNGVETARLRDAKLMQGPVSLQFGNIPPKDLPGGAIKWRKVQIREL